VCGLLLIVGAVVGVVVVWCVCSFLVGVAWVGYVVFGVVLWVLVALGGFVGSGLSLVLYVLCPVVCCGGFVWLWFSVGGLGLVVLVCTCLVVSVYGRWVVFGVLGREGWFGCYDLGMIVGWS
jgi:hypothetical protein